MVVPTPRTWAPGEQPTTEMFNIEIRDNIDWLWSTGRPAFRLTRSTQFNVPAGNPQSGSISFDQESYDTHNGHSVSSNTSRYFIPETGVYLLNGTTKWAVPASSGGKKISLYVRVGNNATYAIDTRIYNADSSVMDPGQSVSQMMRLAAGDYVELFYYQTGYASGVVLSSLQFSGMWMRR